MKILVVDDDPRLREALEVGLQLQWEDTQVSSAADGEAGLEAFFEVNPDLVLLDVNMPGKTGFEVVKEIRRVSDVPVIMLTARAEDTDQVRGLELGADDYVVKPFSPRELVARIRAVLRRTRAEHRPDEVLRVADVEVDVAKMHVTVGDRSVDLTPTEFELLVTLAREPGRVFTRSQLLDAIHGVAIETYERAIDAHVKNLRRKLEPDPRSPRYVLTVHGVGYKFAEP